jgi:hypothetical protein
MDEGVRACGAFSTASVIVDQGGNVIHRSTLDFGYRPLPSSMHKPDA